MSVEVDLLLQEAKESIEAAQNYRSELQQRLHGLNQARKQVPASVHASHTDSKETTPAGSRHHLSVYEALLACNFFVVVTWVHTNKLPLARVI